MAEQNNPDTDCAPGGGGKSCKTEPGRKPNLARVGRAQTYEDKSGTLLPNDPASKGEEEEQKGGFLKSFSASLRSFDMSLRSGSLTSISSGRSLTSNFSIQSDSGIYGGGVNKSSSCSSHSPQSSGVVVGSTAKAGNNSPQPVKRPLVGTRSWDSELHQTNNPVSGQAGSTSTSASSSRRSRSRTISDHDMAMLVLGEKEKSRAMLSVESKVMKAIKEVNESDLSENSTPLNSPLPSGIAPKPSGFSSTSATTTTATTNTSSSKGAFETNSTADGEKREGAICKQGRFVNKNAAEASSATSTTSASDRADLVSCRLDDDKRKTSPPETAQATAADNKEEERRGPAQSSNSSSSSTLEAGRQSVTAMTTASKRPQLVKQKKSFHCSDEEELANMLQQPQPLRPDETELGDEEARQVESKQDREEEEEEEENVRGITNIEEEEKSATEKNKIEKEIDEAMTAADGGKIKKEEEEKEERKDAVALEEEKREGGLLPGKIDTLDKEGNGGNSLNAEAKEKTTAISADMTGNEDPSAAINKGASTTSASQSRKGSGVLKQTSLNDELLSQDRWKANAEMRQRLRKQQSLPVAEPNGAGGSQGGKSGATGGLKESLLAVTKTKQFETLRAGWSMLRSKKNNNFEDVKEEEEEEEEEGGGRNAQSCEQDTGNKGIQMKTQRSSSLSSSISSSSKMPMSPSPSNAPQGSSSAASSTSSTPGSAAAATATSLGSGFIRIWQSWSRTSSSVEEVASFTHKRGVSIQPLDVRNSKVLEGGASARRSLFQRRKLSSPISPKQYEALTKENVENMSPTLRECCMNCPSGEIIYVERERKLSASDSSKEGSITSDTSIDSEDSCVSVIFVPHPEKSKLEEAAKKQRSTSNSSESSDSLQEGRGSPLSPTSIGSRVGLGSPAKSINGKGGELGAAAAATPGPQGSSPSPSAVITKMEFVRQNYDSKIISRTVKEGEQGLTTTTETVFFVQERPLEKIDERHTEESEDEEEEHSEEAKNNNNEEALLLEAEVAVPTISTLSSDSRQEPKSTLFKRLAGTKSFEMEDLPDENPIKCHPKHLADSKSGRRERDASNLLRRPGSTQSSTSSLHSPSSSSVQLPQQQQQQLKQRKQQQRQLPSRSSNRFDYPIVRHHPLFAKQRRQPGESSNFSSLLLGQNVRVIRKSVGGIGTPQDDSDDSTGGGGTDSDGASSGDSGASGRLLAKMSSFEIFNPETDDLDSDDDSSGEDEDPEEEDEEEEDNSSNDSVESVVCAGKNLLKDLVLDQSLDIVPQEQEQQTGKKMSEPPKVIVTEVEDRPRTPEDVEKQDKTAGPPLDESKAVCKDDEPSPDGNTAQKQEEKQTPDKSNAFARKLEERRKILESLLAENNTVLTSISGGAATTTGVVAKASKEDSGAPSKEHKKEAPIPREEESAVDPVKSAQSEPLCVVSSKTPTLALQQQTQQNPVVARVPCLTVPSAQSRRKRLDKSRSVSPSTLSRAPSSEHKQMVVRQSSVPSRFDEVFVKPTTEMEIKTKQNLLQDRKLTLAHLEVSPSGSSGGSRESLESFTSDSKKSKTPSPSSTKSESGSSGTTTTASSDPGHGVAQVCSSGGAIPKRPRPPLGGGIKRQTSQGEPEEFTSSRRSRRISGTGSIGSGGGSCRRSGLPHASSSSSVEAVIGSCDPRRLSIEELSQTISLIPEQLDQSIEGGLEEIDYSLSKLSELDPRYDRAPPGGCIHQTSAPGSVAGSNHSGDADSICGFPYQRLDRKRPGRDDSIESSSTSAKSSVQYSDTSSLLSHRFSTISISSNVSSEVSFGNVSGVSGSSCYLASMSSADFDDSRPVLASSFSMSEADENEYLQQNPREVTAGMCGGVGSSEITKPMQDKSKLKSLFSRRMGGNTSLGLVQAPQGASSLNRSVGSEDDHQQQQLLLARSPRRPMLGSTSSGGGGRPSGRSRIGTETSLETSFENPPTCIDRSSFEEELFRGLEEDTADENGKNKRGGREENNSSSQVR